MLSSQVDRDEPLYIIGPPKIAEYIETSRRVLDMYINYEIVVKEIVEPGIGYSGDGYSVRAFPLRHTKACYGYALEEEVDPGSRGTEAGIRERLCGLLGSASASRIEGSVEPTESHEPVWCAERRR